METILIPLHGRAGVVGHATVDANDAHLAQHRWYRSNRGYVAAKIRRNGQRLSVLLHRMVMEAPRDREVDHINRDPLDCRRSNLRLCTRQQNTQNVGGRSTGFPRGVRRRFASWEARIQIGGVERHIGKFDTMEEAAEARRAEELRTRGAFAPVEA